MEARNNKPASNDWRDSLNNVHLEKNSGSNGYYTEQNEINRPKVYANEGDRLADAGAHVVTVGGQNCTIQSTQLNIQRMSSVMH